MPIEIVVPEVGESIVDARVAKWLKKEGDQVNAGEALVELETDKVDVEVSAPKAGVLAKIAHGDGADVKIGEVLGLIEPGTSGTSGTSGTAGTTGTSGTRNELTPASKDQKEQVQPAPSAAPALAPAAEKAVKDDTAATPSARRAARESNVPLASVPASGPRVTKADVDKATSGTRNELTHANKSEKAPPPAAAPAARPAPGVRGETRERMSKRRATIAKRLVEAQQTAALLTTFNEVDMSAIMALRERHKESFKTRHGVSLGIASFFVKAAITALKEFPRINAEIQGDEIVLKHYYDIGIAVGATEGLVVPVIRDADQQSFAGLEQQIRDFAKRANDGTLTLDDLRGGTFSITNGGVYGSLMSTPIVNPPQVAILGLHAIKERPAAANGQVVLRPMMYLALTYDHRIVDGSEAVRFLVRIKEMIEDPGAMLVM